MTIELVDGKAGTAHISSEDKAIIHQAKFGAGDMVFEWGDAMSCTMQSANKAVIGTGCASIQGLDWHITNPETVTIQSGSSGKNRMTSYARIITARRQLVWKKWNWWRSRAFLAMARPLIRRYHPRKFLTGPRTRTCRSGVSR